MNNPFEMALDKKQVAMKINYTWKSIFNLYLD